MTPVEDIELTGRALVRKLGVLDCIPANIRDDELNFCARGALRRIKERFGITEYDTSNGWHEILATREFLQVLTGAVLADQLTAMTAKYKNRHDDPQVADIWRQVEKAITPRMSREQEDELQDFGLDPGIDFQALLGLPERKMGDGMSDAVISELAEHAPLIHKWFDPSSWNIKTPPDYPEDFRLLRAYAFCRGMLKLQEHADAEHITPVMFAKMAALTRARDRGKGPTL